MGETAQPAPKRIPWGGWGVLVLLQLGVVVLGWIMQIECVRHHALDRLGYYDADARAEELSAVARH